MKKIERILAIIILLLDKEIITTTELAERFKVSTRTIFRDIQTIEYAGFPIISQMGRNGGFSLIETFKLRTLTFTEEEKQRILNALNIKDDLIGTTVDPSVIKEKILLLMDLPFSVNNNISVSYGSVHPPAVEKLVGLRNKKIEKAISQKIKLRINYIDKEGLNTSRVVWPHELGLFNGSWFMKAYCEKKQAFRVFKVTRIRGIDFLDEFFTPRLIDLEEWPIVDAKIVKLQFDKKSLGKLYDFYVDEEIQVLKESILVTFTSYNLSNTASYLLRFGEKLTVVEPKELDVIYKESLKKQLIF